ncbi:MAG: phosphatase PAP2 family protein [bacterium]|nr:phosphatase PAP2 family protein [bacterium]
MQFELEMIKLLQQLRSDFFDALFQFFTMFGEELVIIGILGFLYWVYDKKVGERVGIIVFISLVLNGVIKTLFRRLRPYQVDAEIVNIRPETAGGYSFPSGHTQGAATVFSSLAFYLKKRWLNIVVGVIIFLVAVSRLYIGVHYLTDVVVAVILGVGLSYVFYKFFSGKEDLSKVYQWTLLASFCLLAIVYVIHLFTPESIGEMTNAHVFFDRLEDGFKMTGAMLGFVIGLGFERKYTNFTNHRNIQKNIIRFVLGVGVVMGIRLALSFVFDMIINPEDLLTGQFFLSTIALFLDMIRYASMVFVAIGVFPLLFKKWKI